MGFEPMRAEHIGLAVQRLNHSATSSVVHFREYFPKIIKKGFWNFRTYAGPDDSARS